MISVIVDDLALTQADAIVRPADESLGPTSPAIASLDEKAGPRFAEQRRVASPLKAGAAVVTGSGDLAAPFVLHVVVQDPESEDRTRDRAPGPGFGLAAGHRLGAGYHRHPAGRRGFGPADAWRRRRPFWPRRSPPSRRDSPPSCTSSWTETRIAPWSKPSYGGFRDPTEPAHQTLWPVHRSRWDRPRRSQRGAVRISGPQRRREDHHVSHDRGHPPADQRHGRGRRHRHQPQAARSQGPARLHSRPPLRVRQADRRGVPPLCRGALRPAGARGGAPDRRAARAVRPEPLEERAHRVVQPRDAAEADHLRRAGAPAGSDRGRRADGRARSRGAPGCSRTCSASSWTAAARSS